MSTGLMQEHRHWALASRPLSQPVLVHSAAANSRAWLLSQETDRTHPLIKIPPAHACTLRLLPNLIFKPCSLFRQLCKVYHALTFGTSLQSQKMKIDQNQRQVDVSTTCGTPLCPRVSPSSPLIVFHLVCAAGVHLLIKGCCFRVQVVLTFWGSDHHLSSAVGLSLSLFVHKTLSCFPF